MMIIPINDSVNFVDVNNVVLGFDMGQDCCEYATWSILQPDPAPRSLEPYVFDPSYMVKEQTKHGWQVTFRLVHGKKELFLVLSNVHEGYYSHGFTFKNGTEIIKEGVV